MGKNNRAVAVRKGGKKAPKTKKSLLNPLIKELYRISGTEALFEIMTYSIFEADVNKATAVEDICKQGDLIASKEPSFVPPSYNLNRADAANELIDHLNSQVI